MDDVRAVLDAVGSERAALVGISEGGAMSTVFAATHPERTAALVLIGTFPREMRAADYAAGVSEADMAGRLALLEEDDWASAAGTDWLGRVAPEILRDGAARRWYTSYMRRGASPGAAKALRLMNVEIDIRDLLPTISVPTLVLHRAHESWRDGSRFMGEHIPGARLIELPGEEHLPWEGDRDKLIGEIERFLSGVEEEVEPDRVLATLLLTGIVDTEAGAGAGRDLRAKHDRLVRALLARFRGREVEMLDDGVFATFDGPARAVRCASAIAEGVKVLGLDVRAGVHTGEIEQTVDGVRGMAVRIATRIAAAARPGEILVSGTVKDIVAGSGIVFDERAERHLHGVPGMWRLFSARV
jgi:class 3 adenylate cyclase